MIDGIPNTPASEWTNLRRLYPVYTALAHEFVIEFERLPELEGEIATPSPEALSEAENWFGEMDQRIKVQHLRHFVQTSPQINPEIVRGLLAHHLEQKASTADIRDKVDFLFVQLVSEFAPGGRSDSDLSLEEVSQALEPMLGPAESEPPECLGALDELVREARESSNLHSLFASRVIERGRELKAAAADRFYEPSTMAAFARFGFLMRRTFFTRVQEDVNAILDGLRELESRGVTTLDCREAQLAIDESTSRLRMICQSWKVMFHAEYSSGQPLGILVDLRAAVEQALGHDRAHEPAEAGQVRAKAAAAASSADAASAEFVVSPPPAWNEETGDTPDGEEQR